MHSRINRYLPIAFANKIHVWLRDRRQVCVDKIKSMASIRFFGSFWRKPVGSINIIIVIIYHTFVQAFLGITVSW